MSRQFNFLLLVFYMIPGKIKKLHLILLIFFHLLHHRYSSQLLN
ncbi:hypothetical protein D1BOALGB6SA_10245 [Olavius sp. associated proteobacterium Delta 1]|nr:hypothetical protein D1BOALGB6SA_10245 [Olavius sp. associated proteobacterium Delta 1]